MKIYLNERHCQGFSVFFKTFSLCFLHSFTRIYCSILYFQKLFSRLSLFKRFHPFFFFLENFERSLTSLQEFFSSSFEDKYRE